MLSFWETQSFVEYDFIIIGSGIVGLSTAASILEKKIDSKVLILEQGLFPSWASTKNAGFACFGSITEILFDLANMDENKVFELVELRYKGLQKLRARLGDNQIGYKMTGGHELIFDDKHPALHKTEFLNNFLKNIFQKDVFFINDDLIKTFGFPKTVKHIITHLFEGQIDTGKMMKNLIGYVQKLGATIITGCKVSDLNIVNEKVEIDVNSYYNSGNIKFKSNKVAVCTNAFTKTLIPELDIFPGRGQVIITQPISNLKFNGVFHFNEGYYYFRNVGNRVLFGGGRNLDVNGETTTELAITDLIIDDLTKKLKEIILPDVEFIIEQKWSGIMAFGNDKFPILKKNNDRIIIAARMGGMGVAIGSEWGEQTANLLLQD
jgi:glycine/D-amino acid oxidase-like deaminating enzyme